MLQFSSKWRFQPPEDGTYFNSKIPAKAVSDISDLIGKVATQGKRWDILEHFKSAFCTAAGISHSWSSSESWADSDLSSAMSMAANNAPLFLEAFYDACQELIHDNKFAPDLELINGLCVNNNIGYIIIPPDIVLRDSHHQSSIPVEERPTTLAETALELLQNSLHRSEQLLNEGRFRESVQELLWILESMTTTFKGIETQGGSVKGKYFNDILKDLKKQSYSSTMPRVIEWISALHGFLSSPTGGGVRHGRDLNDGIPIEGHEAKLFCNLIRVYISYLLIVHQQLQSPR